jgi:hypothetical protein
MGWYIPPIYIEIFQVSFILQASVAYVPSVLSILTSRNFWPQFPGRSSPKVKLSYSPVVIPTGFLYRKAPQQTLRTHCSLKGSCATLWWRWRWWLFFVLFQVVEHRWNDIDREQPKYSGKKLSQCHFVHHKSHVNWSRIEPGPPLWEAGGWPPEPWHGPYRLLTKGGVLSNIYEYITVL